MTGRERARQAIRDVGLGIGTVGAAIILTFWGSLATIQVVFVLMTLGVLVWTATTGLDRLRSASGWPRPLLFGGLATLLAINASVFSFTGFPALLVSTGVIGATLVVGATRVLRRVGTESTNDTSGP